MKRIVCLVLSVLLLTMPLACLAQPEGFLSILLIGQDDATSASIEKGQIQYGRADALVVATLNLSTGEIAMLSIDRDYSIALPNQPKTKLCLANVLGGPQLTLEKVNELLGLDLSLYAMVSEADMGKIVGKLGGVTIDIREKDLAATGLRKTGQQKLSQQQAISYMAGRDMDDVSGDVERNDRQRIVLNAIMEQTFASGLEGMLSFAEAVLPLMETNIALMDVLGAASTVVSTGLSSPRQGRSPEKEQRLTSAAAGHFVVYVQDMAQETVRVHAFLYGS